MREQEEGEDDDEGGQHDLPLCLLTPTNLGRDLFLQPAAISNVLNLRNIHAAGPPGVKRLYCEL